MLLLRGVHHFSVTVSFSPFSRVLVPAMCRSPARDRKASVCINRHTRREIFRLVPPTVLKELQVSVAVVEELHVVIGRRVGVLLFLLDPRGDNKVSVEARSQHVHTCINAGIEQHLNTADFMFLRWKEKLPWYFPLIYISQH